MKNQHFWHKKPDFTLFHDFSTSQPSWSVKYEQNITLHLRRNSGEPDLVARIHQNMPKIGCFWAFSHFFIFWGPFFGNLEPQSAFSFIKCGMKYPKWLIYATSIHKTELSNLTKKDIVLRPKHGAKFSELSWFSELLTFADPSRMKEIGIKMNKTCQCSQYRR